VKSTYTDTEHFIFIYHNIAIAHLKCTQPAIDNLIALYLVHIRQRYTIGHNYCQQSHVWLPSTSEVHQNFKLLLNDNYSFLNCIHAHVKHNCDNQLKDCHGYTYTKIKVQTKTGKLHTLHVFRLFQRSAFVDRRVLIYDVVPSGV